MLSFNLLGIPVVIHWTFWLVMAFLGGADRAQSSSDWFDVALFLFAGAFSILVHEFGHALTGLKFGAKRPAIQLYAMGGHCSYQTASFNRWQDFLVTFAGPLASLALCGLSLLAFQAIPNDGPPKILILLIILFRINLFWFILNLLPIIPMDGGHMLRAALGPRRIHIALWISIVVAVVCVIFFLIRESFFISILLAYFAWENYKMLQLERR